MGIFDNILSGLFSRKEETAGDYTLENVSSGLGISSGELEKLMNISGVAPVKNTLTQEQVDKIYDSYYRNLADVSRNDTDYPAHKQIPVKILPSEIISGYSKDHIIGNYKGKWISFSGTVNSADRDGRNFVVRLSSDDRNFHGVIVCKFVNNAENKVMSLRHGQHIKLTGFVHDIQLVYQNDTIIIINSNILDSFSQQRTAKKVSISPITTMPDTLLKRSVIPGVNDKVYTESGKIYTLKKFISSGGEGSVFATDVPGRVAKIYNEQSCSTRRREKIRFMV